MCKTRSRLCDIQITISGSGTFQATDWDSSLQALTRDGKATWINGITGPWREVRHPDARNTAKLKLAVPVRMKGDSVKLP
jgi:hypothetical protein